MQVVYADVLVIVNIYINFILLRLSAAAARRDCKGVRMFAASLTGGLYSLIILVPAVPEWAITVSKIAVGFFMLLIAFGYRNRRAFLRLVGSFLLVDVGFAGLMLALWLIFAPESMLYCCGIVYFQINTFTLLILTVISYAVLSLISKLIAFKAPKNSVYSLTVSFDSTEFEFHAFFDTGNTLTEPFSGYPVIIVSPFVTTGTGVSLADFLSQSERLPRIVPCTALGKNTALTAYQPDCIRISGIEADFETDAVYVALSRDKILNGDYTALLCAKIFENNIDEKGKDYASISEIQSPTCRK